MAGQKYRFQSSILNFISNGTVPIKKNRLNDNISTSIATAAATSKSSTEEDDSRTEDSCRSTIHIDCSSASTSEVVELDCCQHIIETGDPNREHDFCEEIDDGELHEADFGEIDITNDKDTSCFLDCCQNISPTNPVHLPVAKVETVRYYGEGPNRRPRFFQFSWYKKYSWLVLCKTRKVAFCNMCRFAIQTKLITWSKCGDQAFLTKGFHNWKDGSKLLDAHEKSNFHRECTLKLQSLKKVPVSVQLVNKTEKDQDLHRQFLLEHLRVLQVLARQGLAIRGNTDEDSNFKRVLSVVGANHKLADQFTCWLKSYRYGSHDILNELLQEMYRCALQQLRKDIEQAGVFAVIVDETRDISGLEQLTFCIRWVNEDYTIHEDFIGLYEIEQANADYLMGVMKDVLLRLGFDFQNLRGQTYDGASTFQGMNNGVCVRIKEQNPSALSLHCLNHSLNLCLQDATKYCYGMRDALNLCGDLYNLIHSSPKRLALFNNIRAAFPSEQTLQSQTLKPLCPTRWTARKAAIDAVINNYEYILDTLHEVSEDRGNTEASKRAPGMIAVMNKYDTFFNLKLGLKVFSATENMAYQLQAKDISAEVAMNILSATTAYFERMKSDDEFAAFYTSTLKSSEGLTAPPVPPRTRRPPRRYDDGSEAHTFASAEDYFRKEYFALLDILINKMNDRFEQETLHIMLKIEKLIIGAINASFPLEPFEVDAELQRVYSRDINFKKLQIQLEMLPDTLQVYNKSKSEMCKIKTVTKLSTVREVLLNVKGAHLLLGEVHRLLQLYLTIPMSNATAERSFSSMRRIKSYLRSSMTQKRLNHLMFLHVHKNLCDSIDLYECAKQFCDKNDMRKQYFGLWSET